MNVHFLGESLFIKRYPATKNRSLQPWNAADELMLDFVRSQSVKSVKMSIFNDRFGFLSCFLNDFHPQIIIDYKSQEKSIRMNLEANKLTFSEDQFQTPLSPFSNSMDLALIKTPKSLDLFRLYLYQLSQNLTKQAVVICGFMTKYFSPQLLTIANEFFEDVEQSKARKKARLLILKRPKSAKEISVLNTITLDEPAFKAKNFQQYFGVFSANHIDYATQFLIKNIQIKENEHRVLDLACGNGILAYGILQQNPKIEMHVLDDFFLAIESAKLNLDEKNTRFHYSDNLDDFEDDFFDWIVSNPPFHFEFETNIEVSVSLFHQVKRCLHKHGRFVCVANQHLNYKTHLEKIFGQVITIAENEKFVIYECR